MLRFLKGVAPWTALAVVLAVPFVSAASASALGPTAGDPVDTSAEITQPSTADPPAAAGLDLSVFTDSVVATATLRYSGTPPDVIVAWGDGARTRTSPPTASVPGRPSPTAGRLVFQHQYAAPINGARFFNEHVSVVSPVSAWELVGTDVVIIPRYRVTQHAVEFSPLNHCDSIAEAYTEWNVLRDGGGLPYKEWNFDRHTADVGGVGVPLPDFEPLPDSALSVEVTVGHAPRIGYSATEMDPFQDEYFNRQFVDFDPLLGSRTLTLTYGEKYGGDCRIQIRTAMDVQLLTPGVQSGPVASQ